MVNLTSREGARTSSSAVGKRVLVVDLAGSLWGSERALLDLLRYMDDVRVTVCCPPNRPLIHELAKLGIPCIPSYVYETHKKTRWHRLWAAIGVLRACLMTRPNVIYLNQSGAYKVVLPAATLMNIPIISHVRIHGDAKYIADIKSGASRLRLLIAISVAIQKEIREFKALDKVPVQQIYDGYRFSITDSLLPSDRSSRRIAFIGRLVPMKGPDVLIRALGVLHREKSEIDCLIAGDGEADYVAELNALAAKELGAQPTIKWIGTIRDVFPLLRTSSLLIVSSDREALGRVIFEAWDAGTIPVVFAGSGGAAEVVKASKGGILYSEQTEESLARAIEDGLRLSQEERAELVANGRRWLRENCDAARYAHLVSGLIKRQLS